MEKTINKVLQVLGVIFLILVVGVSLGVLADILISPHLSARDASVRRDTSAAFENELDTDLADVNARNESPGDAGSAEEEVTPAHETESVPDGSVTYEQNMEYSDTGYLPDNGFADGDFASSDFADGFYGDDYVDGDDDFADGDFYGDNYIDSANLGARGYSENTPAVLQTPQQPTQTIRSQITVSAVSGARIISQPDSMGRFEYERICSGCTNPQWGGANKTASMIATYGPFGASSIRCTKCGTYNQAKFRGS